MANYATLKAAIQDVIKTNGNKEITGALLQQSLLAMVNSLGGYYDFAGIATESTVPGTPDQNVFYIAGSGTYANFGGAEIPEQHIGVLYGSGSTWNVSTIKLSSSLNTGVSNLNLGYNINLVPNRQGFEIGSINDTTGADVALSSRLRTGYIPVADTKYYILQISIWRCEVLCYKYENGNYTYLGYSSGYVVDDGEFSYKTGTTHIRLLVQNASSNTPEPTNDIAACMFVCDRNKRINYTQEQEIPGLDKRLTVSENRLNVESPFLPNTYLMGLSVATTGARIANANTYITPKIPVVAGDSILWNFGGSAHDTNNCLCVYDSSDARLDFFRDNALRATNPITMPQNASYIVATMSIANRFDGWLNINNNIAWVFPYSFSKNNADEIGKIRNEIYGLDKTKNCYVDQYWNGYATRGEQSGYIAGYIIPCVINVGDTVEWGIADGANPSTTVRLNFYNEAGGAINYWGSAGGANGIRIGQMSYQNVKMVAVSGIYSDNFRPYLKINGVLVFEACKETGIIAKETGGIFHLRIAQWNMGNLNYGNSGPMPDSELETALPLLKKNFTNIRADILFINECQQYINQGDGGQTQQPLYATLLKQFYPYYVTLPTDWMGCFSKVGFAMETINPPSGGSRNHRFGVLTIAGKDVAIAFVHCSPASVAERIAELTAIAAEFANYDYGIIVGDTNITNNNESQANVEAQMQPLIDAGFVFGNMGYWGLIPTLSFNPDTPTVGPTRATDNIMVKGFNIDNFESFVEKDENGNYQSYYSDHYPIRAEISTQ